jgi:hypothetical protein
MKKLFLFGAMLFIAYSQAQTGLTCSSAANFTISTDGLPLPEKQFDSTHWYKFIPEASDLDIEIVSFPSASLDKLSTGIVFSGVCSGLSQIGKDSISSSGDSVLKLSLTGLTIGNTYFLEINKNKGTDTLEYLTGILYKTPTTTCSPVANVCDVVCNGNFESYTSVPNFLDQIIKAAPWNKIATLGTTDYFNGNATVGICDVTTNGYGDQASRNVSAGDKGYAGIYAWGTSNNHEYLYQQLRYPLTVGVKFRASMWVSFAEGSSYVTNQLGMYFSVGNPATQYAAIATSAGTPTPVFSTASPQVLSGLTSITNRTTWIQVTGDFTGNGEQYITVGGFSNTNSGISAIGSPKPGAYYYIDEITVVPVDPVLTASPPVICPPPTGGSSTITSDLNPVFVWTPNPSSLSCYTCPSPVATPTVTTTYYGLLNYFTGCSVSLPITVTVSPPVTVNSVSNISACKNDVIAAGIFSSTPAGATYTWTNSNIAIGLGASGSGNVPSFTATNTGTSPISGTITVLPTLGGCVGTALTYTITVNPRPTITPSSIPNITVCKNGTVGATSFASPTTGATFTWTNSNIGIGLAASGSGNIGSFTGINTGTAPVTAIITVTPASGVCPGTSATYTITVNPQATVTTPSSFAVCNSATIAASSFTSPTTGATFTWTNSNAAIGLAVGGSGNVPAFAATNTTGSPISGTITVTPLYAGCAGTPSTYIITVNPGVTITASASPASIALGSTSSLSSSSSTGTYSWSPAATLSSSTISNPVATPTSTTTYTVSASNSYGCSASATATVAVVYVQCGLTIQYDVTSNSTSTSVFGTSVGTLNVINRNIHVASGVTLTINNNISFSGCNFNMEAGASIVLVTGYTMTLTDKTHLFACNDMWDGIYIPTQAYLIIQGNAFIEDALNAVVSQGGGSYTINTAIFNRNLKAIDVQTYTVHVHPGTIVNSIITSRYIPSFVSTGNVSNYSVANLISYPLTGFPAADMRSPNQGFKGVYGVYGTSLSLINIGAAAAASTNTFDQIMAGIYLVQSNAVVYNNRFQNLLNPTVTPCFPGPCYNVTGFGVKAVGTSSGTYDVTIGGTGAYQANTFYNCYRAAELTDCKFNTIVGNSIDNSVTAVSPAVGYGNVGIYVKPASNNSIVVTDNSPIKNCATGIWINRAFTSAISTNVLQVNANGTSTSPISADASGHCNNGIYVTDLLAGTTVVPTTSEILGNVATEVVDGISISNVKKPLNIESNSITVHYASTGSRDGIKAVGCQGVTILTNHTKYNNIGGTAYTSGGNLTAYGIFLQNSSNMIVKCNLIEDAARSLVFQGTCTSPTAGGYGITQNTMRRAQDGFVLLSSGVIGTQGSSTVASNNYWDLSTTPAFTNSQTYTTVTNANTASVLYMNNVTTGVIATMPTNNQTSVTFGVHNYLSGSGLNVSSGTPSSCAAAPAFMAGGGDELLVTDAQESGDGSPEYATMLENTITETYADDNIRWMREKYVFEAITENDLSGSSLLDSFYNAAHNFAALKSVEDAINNGNYSQAMVLNDAIVPVNNIESIQQTMNSLMLSQLSDNTYVYTDDEKAALYDISLQCPVSSGYAVYQARNLLMSIEDNVIAFEDHCDEAEKRYAQKIQAKKPAADYAFRLYPNPNNGNMLLEYNISEQDKGILEITDLTGNRVQQYNLPAGENKLRIRDEGLESGMYIYHVIMNDKIVKSDKLLIIK